MTQKKDNGLSAELQTVLLDEYDFLKTLVQQCLQQMLQAEFDNLIKAGPNKRSL